MTKQLVIYFASIDSETYIGPDIGDVLSDTEGVERVVPIAGRVLRSNLEPAEIKQAVADLIDRLCVPKYGGSA